MDHHRVPAARDTGVLEGPLHNAQHGEALPVRASDDDRATVVRVLELAAGAGMLTLAETDERLGRAYAARTRAELVPLTADLPDHGQRLLENTPEARSAARTGLRRHAGSIALVSVLLLAVWVAAASQGGEPHFFWPALPLFFMWFGVLGHARRVRR
jgi:hypothetical protein